LPEDHIARRYSGRELIADDEEVGKVDSIKQDVGK
jgi:hypothetical protein